MKRVLLVVSVLACVACGAGSRRPVEMRHVSPSLAGAEAELPIAWVETGHARYDAFFREAAALQAAVFLAERAAAGEGNRERLREILQGVGPRAQAARAEGEALLPRARADFAHDELKELAIEPAVFEALGQVRDAAERAPALLDALR